MPETSFQTLNAKPIPYKVSFRESYWFEVRRFYKTASCHSVLKCPQLEGLIVWRWDPSTDSNTHNIPLNPKQETEASSSSQHRCQASSSQKPSHLVLDDTSANSGQTLSTVYVLVVAAVVLSVSVAPFAVFCSCSSFTTRRTFVSLAIAAAMGGQTAIALQSLQAISQLNIQWVQPVKEFLRVLAMALNGFQTGVTCFVEGTSFATWSFALQLLAFPVFCCSDQSASCGCENWERHQLIHWPFQHLRPDPCSSLDSDLDCRSHAPQVQEEPQSHLHSGGPPAGDMLEFTRA